MENLNLCPDCGKGKLYEHKTEDGYTERSCYVCGYYWVNSKSYDSLTVKLHKEYFPTEEGWEASPIMGRGFKTPKEWTEPSRV